MPLPIAGSPLQSISDPAENLRTEETSLDPGELTEEDLKLLRFVHRNGWDIMRTLNHEWFLAETSGHALEGEYLDRYMEYARVWQAAKVRHDDVRKREARDSGG